MNLCEGRQKQGGIQSPTAGVSTNAQVAQRSFEGRSDTGLRGRLPISD